MMRVVRDLVMILGDTLRLSEDAMQRTWERPKQIVKRTASRIITLLVVGAVSVVIAGAGLGFILGGCFVLLAGAMDSPGVAGLIIGFALLLIALVTMMVGRSLVSRG